MEFANRIFVVIGQQVLELVKMSKLIEKSSEDEIRSFEYQCPDSEQCGVPVYPALPEKEKGGRQKAPRAYFRAGKAQPHKDCCRRDGVCMPPPSDVKPTTPPLGDGSSKGPGLVQNAGVTTEIGDIPRRFVEGETRGDPPGDDGDHPNYPPGGDPRWTSGVDDGGNSKKRVSETGTRHVIDLVRVYETYSRERLESEPLDISRCPGRMYREVAQQNRTGR